jgi:hypothetical protein
MDGLMGAIRNRRGGRDEQIAEDQPVVGNDSGAGSAQELKGLVASLDESQKALLLKMLAKDQTASENAPALETGAMGPGESMEVEEYVSDMEPEEGHESEEEIMESMISSADKTRADRGTEPRNLGERMKVGLANKLKKKG